jgi:hypothetical protein
MTAVRVPPVAGASNAWRDRIFLPEHVAPIAEATGLSLRENFDLDRGAVLLSGAFEMAMTWAELDRSGAAPGELREWHARVADAVANLLAVLGQDPDAMAKGERDGTPIPLHPATRHFWSIATAMEARYPPVPPEMDRWLRGSIAFCSLCAQRREAAQATHPDDSPVDHDLKARTLTAADAATEMLPEVLGIVLAIARAGAGPARGKPRGGGRAQDVFRRELFADLAGAAEAMFGRQPRARDVQGRRSGTPQMPCRAWWVNAAAVAAPPPDRAMERRPARRVSPRRNNIRPSRV